LYRTYIDIISIAKQKLEWLLNELNSEWSPDANN
jgi:hypothetical protein